MELLQKEFYMGIHEKYGCFPETLPLLCQTVEEIQLDAEKRQVFLALHERLKTPEIWDDTVVVPEGHTMLSAMAVLSYMPQMIEELMAEGFSREIAVATAKDVDAETMEAALSCGHPGMDAHLVKWFTKYLRRTIVRIGRLNYEKCTDFRGKIRIYENAEGERVTLAWNMSVNEDGDAVQAGEEEAVFAEGKEAADTVTGYGITDGLVEKKTTTLKKKNCRLLLSEGDHVIHMHIPAFEPFHPDIVAESYRQALPILERCWPDFRPKAVVCKSWLMSPALKTMLSETSNLLAFQKPYTPFPSKANVTSALSCVFHMTPEDYKVLPEETSLQRAMKAHYLAGGVVRFQFAYWLIDDFKKEFYHE